MNISLFRKWFLIPAALAAILGWKFLLPVALPFLMGSILALAAEPVVSFLERRLHFRRFPGTAVGVTVTLVLLSCLLLLAAALICGLPFTADRIIYNRMNQTVVETATPPPSFDDYQQ